MHAFTTLVALFATAMTVSALPPLLDTLSTTDFLLPPLSGGNNDGNNGGDNRDDDRDNDDNSPDCGGQKAMCCSGTYGGEGLVVDNCVTCKPPYDLANMS